MCDGRPPEKPKANPEFCGRPGGCADAAIPRRHISPCRTTHTSIPISSVLSFPGAGLHESWSGAPPLSQIRSRRGCKSSTAGKQEYTEQREPRLGRRV